MLLGPIAKPDIEWLNAIFSKYEYEQDVIRELYAPTIFKFIGSTEHFQRFDKFCFCHTPIRLQMYSLGERLMLKPRLAIDSNSVGDASGLRSCSKLIAAFQIDLLTITALIFGFSLMRLYPTPESDRRYVPYRVVL